MYTDFNNFFHCYNA